MRSITTALLLLLTLAGCGRLPLPDQPAPDSIGNFVEGYILEPGNRVRVIVFNEPNLSGEFTIDASGNLSMPLIGTVSAVGATSGALASRIEGVLTKSNYLLNPKIAVETLTYRPFYVLGEVKQPGEFPYVVGMTVLSAIARAGGYDYRARQGDVILVRIINKVEQHYRAVERTPILPGDIVRVTERYF